MRKLLIFITALSLMLAVATIPVLAADDSVSIEEVEGVEAIDTESTKSDTSSEEEKESNVFELAYDEIVRHSDKILSALAFISSLVLAFAYNKGLLPVLRGALDKLQGVVTGIRDSAQTSASVTEDAVSKIEGQLESASAVIVRVADSISSLESRLTAIEEGNEGKILNTVMRSQVDMLYEIFMSSSLPQYQKEVVGERISEMRKSLAEVDDHEPQD